MERRPESDHRHWLLQMQRTEAHETRPDWMTKDYPAAGSTREIDIGQLRSAGSNAAYRSLRRAITGASGIDLP